MEKVVLQAAKRDVLGKKVRALRRQGKLPAVLYGHRIESTPVMLDAHDTALKLSRLTSSSLVTVDLEGQEYPALVRQKQRHPIKGHFLHLDFQVLSMTEKMRTKVGVELSGEAPAVKEFNAVILPVVTELEVECLPQDLPERLVVDISGLTEIGSAVHVRDVVVAPGVEILEDPDASLVVAAAPAPEEVIEEAAPEAGPEVGETPERFPAKGEE
jgi:large subunit ribosomal protein L25